MHVKVVTALPRQQAAIVAWVFTCRARPVKVDLTDTTNIVFRYVPAPSSDRIPLLDGDLHDVLRKESHGIDIVEMRISGARIETQSGRATSE